MVMEKEAPFEIGIDKIKYMLTESSVPDSNINDFDVDLNDIILGYGDQTGKIELRELLAKEYQNVPPDNILVTVGACMGLFIVNAFLLDREDHVVVQHPNYAANFEVPKSLGIDMTLLQLSFEDEFAFDVCNLEKLIKKNTKLLSITYPHNPTGVTITEKKVKEIIELAENHDCYLLVDETYRELTYGPPLPTAASLSPNAISVESLSKTYGAPGIRIGWIATQDPDLKESFLATKEQISICNSLIDEEVAYAIMLKKDQLLKRIQVENQTKFDIMTKWMEEQPEMEWIVPQAGVLCFPRIKSEVNIDVPKFYDILNNKYGTYVGPGHWFGFDDRYMRIGYGYPSIEDLESGLNCITKSIQEAKK